MGTLTDSHITSAFSIADKLANRCGPGAFMLVIREPVSIAIELQMLGCTVCGMTADTDLFDNLIVSTADNSLDSIRNTIGELIGKTRRYVVLLFDSDLLPTDEHWGSFVRGLGLRRAPADVRTGSDDIWVLEKHDSTDGLPDPLFDDPQTACTPLSLFTQAADLVRPGDRVLVQGCGTGAGAALIAATTRARSVAAQDNGNDSILQACRNYADRYSVRFACRELEGVASEGTDLLVALSGVPDDPQEIVRILRPDGRAVVLSGLAGKWSMQELAERGDCLVEDIRPTDDPQASLIVLSRNPVAGTCLPYVHPQFGRSANGAPVVTFGGHYENPWIYRSMIQMGERVHSTEALTQLALEVLSHSQEGGADAGAALCVLAYQVVQRRLVENAGDIIDLAQAYLSVADQSNPHCRRWSISIAFACALTCLMTSARASAATWFERVMSMDALAFSPLLCTKQVAAAFWLGIFALVDGAPARASAYFLEGTHMVEKALQEPIERAVGSTHAPAAFGFTEIAELCDMAAQCANAMESIDLYGRAPSLFWQRVHARRFGLATWLQQLERENASLREALMYCQSQLSE